MKLYQFPWGIYPRRIHVYLKEKGISGIEMVELDVVAGDNRKPDYLARNPTGTIPALETDDGRVICQSSTILLYLEQLHPSPDMIGGTPADQARTHDQLALVNEAYNFAGICTYYGSPLFVQRRKPSDEVAKAMHFEYARVLASLEGMAGGGDYLGGETPNIADVTFFASEQFMRDLYKLRLPKELTKLEAIFNRFLQRPSAAPEAYPDFMVPIAPLRDFL
ncbi:MULTISPECIES: glutathione S-transferase family protein [unclassified Sphingomonas]|uniref:glutathione S-transferase family protein n=1 Tax=unclassified Sphingomonas TaxID=196159 RepID=UPI0006F40C13|nr:MULTISPECIES: glutathione S-transferase family protein [unclassified Sphingomonas]KQX23424.1 hypothetical protein ASD17_03740 [Sphingomonas sp. Root1294]KQY68275.1 hypothetical protein ASD39_06260 [Sphingomonas sp. Root50]KRB91175.1 hypothetical protein ASE22_13065 [Sphingomonas sp. Root720]